MVSRGTFIQCSSFQLFSALFSSLFEVRAETRLSLERNVASPTMLYVLISLGVSQYMIYKAIPAWLVLA